MECLLFLPLKYPDGWPENDGELFYSMRNAKIWVSITAANDRKSPKNQYKMVCFSTFLCCRIEYNKRCKARIGHMKYILGQWREEYTVTLPFSAAQISNNYTHPL